MATLDLTAFQNALNSLDEVIEKFNQDKTDKIVRDSLIQRFEYTYSLSIKMIKRYFKNSAFIIDNVEDMTFNEMIRQANKMSLLKSNLEKWTIYRQKRNSTSHTYDENVANDVVSIIEEFFSEALFLLNKLKEKSV